MFYIHETTDLNPGAVDDFVEAFDTEYAPLMRDLGARLVSLWETVPFTFKWPQTVALWEIDDMRVLAEIGRAQRQEPTGARRFAQWRSTLGGMSTGGEGRILTPSPGSPTIAQLRENGVSPGVCVQERIHTIPGMQFAYLRQLERLYIPWALKNGRQWLGTFTTNWKNSEAILIWAWEEGWDTLGVNYGRQAHIIEHDPDLQTWMECGLGLRDDWHDALLESLRSY